MRSVDSLAKNPKDINSAKLGNLALRLTFLILTLNKNAFTQQLSFRCVRSTNNENSVERNRSTFWTPYLLWGLLYKNTLLYVF